jgi:hypothetical protein
MNQIIHKIKAINIDVVGATLSIVCGIHCVVFPLLMMAQPVLKDNFFFSESVEQVIILASLIIASTSFTMGYLKHKKSTPFLMFLVSFGLIIGLQLEVIEVEILFMPVAGFLLAMAHIYNHRLLH